MNRWWAMMEKGQLQLQFHKEMLNIYEEARKIGYNASRFKQMVANQGGYVVAKKLINNNTPSDGFVSLWELGRLDLTVEALILKEEYRPLFSDEERELVINRLKEYGFEVPQSVKNVKENKNTWIFQGNPSVFDINNYVKNHKYIWWSLRQEHFRDKIQLNDEVFLWRSDGGRKGTGGIIAKCKVAGLPQERADDSSAKDYWYTDDWKDPYLAVKLEVLDVRIEDGFISRLSLLEHPILNNLLILRLRQQTNYLLSNEHAVELNKLWDSNIENQIQKDIESELAEEDDFYTDGTVKEFYGKRYERNPKNRRKAIEFHGLNCIICGFNFEEVYGERGKDFIEVHHVKPLSTIKEEVEINPETDLVPVCANCHRMIHRRKDEVYSIEQMKAIIKKKFC
jgi:5-methylcytosine-specific restriction protein A